MSGDGQDDQLKLQARLRELLSIPEHLRSDAHWDELVEIEIEMAPRKRSANVTREAAAMGRPKRHWKQKPPGRHESYRAHHRRKN